MKAFVLLPRQVPLMPDFFVTPFDNFHHKGSQPLDTPITSDCQDATTHVLDPAKLPKSGIQAVLRGVRSHCPSCDHARLFGRFLKPIDRCTSCGQDWSLHQADDFPAYVAILLTGHIVAPIIIALINHTNLPMWGIMVLILSLATTMMMALLQPAKGAIIAVQWWLGMHDFVKPVRISSVLEDLR